MVMEENRLSGEKPIENNGKDEKGWFTKGNKYGRFPKDLTLQHLTKLFREEEKRHLDKKTILQHYKERLMKSDNLLAKFIDKYVPTKTINEITGKDGSPLTVTLKKVIYSEEKEK